MQDATRAIKKIGNKVYTLGQKIQECQDKGMKTRVPAYIEELEKCSNNLTKQIQEIKKES